MTITRNINGSFIVSDLIEGHLVSVTYYEATEEEAIEAFKYEFQTGYCAVCGDDEESHNRPCDGKR